MNPVRISFRNVRRNRIRAVLTIASVFFSILLLCVLEATLTMWTNTQDDGAAALRLVVRNKNSLAQPLPEAYRQKLERVEGVDLVHSMSWFGGKIKDNERFFPQFAADPKTTFRMYSEQKVSPETQAAYEAEKTAAVVGVLLLQDMGWKVGDRITLLGTAYPVDVDLRIVGTYEGGDATWLWFRQDYLDELLGNPGIVGTFWLRVRSADDVAKVTEAVDAMFANSFSPTKTETENGFNLSFLEMLGNIRLLIGLFGGAAVFTSLLVAGNSMAMTVRERTGEIAILKTLGFGRGHILALIVGEAVFLTLAGGVLGVAAALPLAAVIRGAASGWFANFLILPRHVAMGLGLSILVGLLAGLGPAWRGASLRIADGLRKID